MGWSAESRRRCQRHEVGLHVIGSKYETRFLFSERICPLLTRPAGSVFPLFQRYLSSEARNASSACCPLLPAAYLASASRPEPSIKLGACKDCSKLTKNAGCEFSKTALAAGACKGSQRSAGGSGAKLAPSTPPTVYGSPEQYDIFNCRRWLSGHRGSAEQWGPGARRSSQRAVSDRRL